MKTNSYTGPHHTAVGRRLQGLLVKEEVSSSSTQDSSIYDLINSFVIILIHKGFDVLFVSPNPDT
jgi:hypothetical protein